MALKQKTLTIDGQTFTITAMKGGAAHALKPSILAHIAAMLANLPGVSLATLLAALSGEDQKVIQPDGSSVVITKPEAWGYLLRVVGLDNLGSALLALLERLPPDEVIRLRKLLLDSTTVSGPRDGDESGKNDMVEANYLEALDRNDIKAGSFVTDRLMGEALMLSVFPFSEHVESALARLMPKADSKGSTT